MSLENIARELLERGREEATMMPGCWQASNLYEAYSLVCEVMGYDLDEEDLEA